MAATAPAPWLNLAKMILTELTRLIHELQDVGRGPIASPDISLGDAIVKNIHFQAVNNGHVQEFIDIGVIWEYKITWHLIL